MGHPPRGGHSPSTFKAKIQNLIPGEPCDRQNPAALVRGTGLIRIPATSSKKSKQQADRRAIILQRTTVIAGIEDLDNQEMVLVSPRSTPQTKDAPQDGESWASALQIFLHLVVRRLGRTAFANYNGWHTRGTRRGVKLNMPIYYAPIVADFDAKARAKRGLSDLKQHLS